jgi:hypothetical protein
VLLKDSEELTDAHAQLRTGKRGRQWGLGALNRAVVVSAVSAWEAYLEAVVLEAIAAARPQNPALHWSSWNAAARSAIGRFNNPNPDQVFAFLRDTLGLTGIASHWSWPRCSSQLAEQRLGEALRIRHEIAHGVNPRPIVHNTYARALPGFFRKLGECTDSAIKTYAQTSLAVTLPW